MRRGQLASLFAVVVIPAFCGLSSRAATIVPMSDVDLAVSSRAIVEGQVLGVESEWIAERRAVYRYVTVDVERVYKGEVAPGLVVLKELGGHTQLYGTEVPGTPLFAKGERAILFLNTDRDGALHVAHFFLGHYTVVSEAQSDRSVVVRDLEGTLDSSSSGTVTNVADRDAFVAALLSNLRSHPAEVAWYRARYDGSPIRIVPPEYLVRGGRTTYSDTNPHFTLLEPGFRWFEPDSGGAIPYRMNGKAAPTPSHGVDECRAALAAWTRVSGSGLELRFAGKSSGGGHAADGANEIAFGDPLGEIDDPVNCTGVVASGGVTTATGETIAYNGKAFHRILEGDVVVNNGFECLLSNPTVLTEILTHELGHTVGIGHSSERFAEPDSRLLDATMYFVIHNDGRGASLRTDDSNAARALYAKAEAESPLVLVSSAVPDAVPGQLYTVSLEARGGTTPYVWSVASGDLPPGITLAQDGRLSGRATSVGASTFVATVRDAHDGERSVSLLLRASSMPSPFLERASFDTASGKLRVFGQHLSSPATLELNEVPSTPSVRLNATRKRLTFRLGKDRAGLKPRGTNTVTIVVGDVRSNVVTF